MMPMIRSLCLALMVATIGACSTVPAVSSKSTFEQTLSLGHAVYTGRFSISHTKDGQLQRDQGRFEWTVALSKSDAKNEPTAMRLALLSPLGNTAASIVFDPRARMDERAQFNSGSHSEYATDLDSLMFRTLGWRLPLLAMMPWLGQSAPEQSPEGWKIAVVSRHDTGLPKLITADNTGLALNVRLVFEP